MISKKSLVKEGLWWSAGTEGEFAISSSIRFGSILKSFTVFCSMGLMGSCTIFAN